MSGYVPFSLGRLCLNTASCLGRKELRLHYSQLLIYTYFSVKTVLVLSIIFLSERQHLVHRLIHRTVYDTFAIMDTVVCLGSLFHSECNTGFSPIMAPSTESPVNTKTECQLSSQFSPPFCPFRSPLPLFKKPLTTKLIKMKHKAALAQLFTYKLVC